MVFGSIALLPIGQNHFAFEPIRKRFVEFNNHRIPDLRENNGFAITA